MFVQVLVLLASLSEFRGRAPVPTSSSVSGVSAPGTGSDRGQRPAHDESTCPACIVRSLHARLETLAPLPVSLVEQSHVVISTAASIPPLAVALSNLSRAPPAAG